MKKNKNMSIKLKMLHGLSNIKSLQLHLQHVIEGKAFTVILNWKK